LIPACGGKVRKRRSDTVPPEGLVLDGNTCRESECVVVAQHGQIEQPAGGVASEQCPHSWFELDDRRRSVSGGLAGEAEEVLERSHRVGVARPVVEVALSDRQGVSKTVAGRIGMREFQEQRYVVSRVRESTLSDAPDQFRSEEALAHVRPGRNRECGDNDGHDDIAARTLQPRGKLALAQ